VVGGIASFARYFLTPYFVLDTPSNQYLTSGPEVSDNLSELMTSVALGPATTIDKGGVLKWGLHNFITESIPTTAHWTEDSAVVISDTAGGLRIQSGGNTYDRGENTADEDLVAGAQYTWKFEYTEGTSGNVRFTIYETGFNLNVNGPVGAASIINDTGATGVSVVNEALGGDNYRLTVVATASLSVNNEMGFGPLSSVSGEDIYLTKAWCYRSDLGGMQLSSKDGTDYLPTAGASGYALRRDYSRLPVKGQTLGEPAGVNGIRNNTMQGAVVGTIGSGGAFPTSWGVSVLNFPGTSTSVVGLGTENGMPYIDIRLNGTPTGNPTFRFEQTATIAAADGETWARSLYAKIASGSLTNINVVALQQRTFTSAPAYHALKQETVVLSSTLQRFSAVSTLADADGTGAIASTLLDFGMDWTSGAINLTVRLALPQMEEYHVATSVIPTYGASEARAKDEASCVIADKIPGFIQGSGSIVFEGSIDYEAGGSGFPYLFDISDGTNNNTVRLYANESNSKVYTVVRNAGSGQGNTQGAVASGAVTKVAFRYSDEIGTSFDGAVAGAVGPITTPVGLTTVAFGAISGVPAPTRISHLSIGPYASPAGTSWTDPQLAVISGS
jgi:hypothetical protein